MEHPQEVIRMLFVAIILIFSIVIIYNLMQDMEIRDTYRVNNLKYNAISARILYSADCYAWEETYQLEDGTERHQVHAGVLDFNKLGENKLNSCVDNALATSKITVDEKEYKGVTIDEKLEEVTEAVIDMLKDPLDTNKIRDVFEEADSICGGKWSRTDKMLVLVNTIEGLKGGVAEIKVCV